MHFRINIKDARNRAIRTAAQFVVSGAFMEVINALIVPLDPTAQLLLTGVLQLAVSYAHNYLEDKGVIPTVGKDQVAKTPVAD
jgi:hypothetical protein